MRHARTGTAQTPDRLPLSSSAVAAHSGLVPAVDPVHVEAAPPLDPWTWPEAPDLPSTPALKRGDSVEPAPCRAPTPVSCLPRTSPSGRCRGCGASGDRRRRSAYGLPPTAGSGRTQHGEQQHLQVPSWDLSRQWSSAPRGCAWSQSPVTRSGSSPSSSAPSSVRQRIASAGRLATRTSSSRSSGRSSGPRSASS